MGRLRMGFRLATLVVIVSASLVVLWPLTANGVTGSAASPRYHAFGFSTFHPLSANPTTAELRHAGIRLPQDVVAHRRHIAAVLGWAALAAVVLLGAREYADRRHRRP